MRNARTQKQVSLISSLKVTSQDEEQRQASSSQLLADAKTPVPIHAVPRRGRPGKFGPILVRLRTIKAIKACCFGDMSGMSALSESEDTSLALTTRRSLAHASALRPWASVRDCT